jgi:hypothetical protein
MLRGHARCRVPLSSPAVESRCRVPLSSPAVKSRCQVPLCVSTFSTTSRRPSAAAGCGRLASLAVLAGQPRDDQRQELPESDHCERARLPSRRPQRAYRTRRGQRRPRATRGTRELACRPSLARQRIRQQQPVREAGSRGAPPSPVRHPRGITSRSERQLRAWFDPRVPGQVGSGGFRQRGQRAGRGLAGRVARPRARTPTTRASSRSPGKARGKNRPEKAVFADSR